MAIVNGYCTIADLHGVQGANGPNVVTSVPDTRLEDLITAVSREIDQQTGRRFYAATETRYFTPRYVDVLWLPDFVSLTTLATDLDGSRTYAYVWTAADYDLEPYNAPLESQPKPYTHISTTPLGIQFFPAGMRKGVKIIASWGYSATTPPVIREVCMLACQRLLRRPDSPLGIQGSDAAGAAIRITLQDPDVKRMLLPFKVWSIG